MGITPFNKEEKPTMAAFNERMAQVLTDENAQKYGGDGTTTPDDLFSLLSKAALIGSDGLTDVLGNAVTVGAKIQTGSYVGTGTYGADNPCSLTFDFAPRYVVLTDHINPNTNGNPSNSEASFPFWASSGIYVSVLYSEYSRIIVNMDILETEYQKRAYSDRGEYYFNNGFSMPTKSFINNISMNYYGTAKKSEDGKTLYWFGRCHENNSPYTDKDSSPITQANILGYIYYWMAIG